LVDISHLQQLPTDGVEAGPADRSRRQAPDMGASNVQNAPDDRKAANEPDLAGRRSDGADCDRMIDILDLDAYLLRRPMMHTRSVE
jgi:hypothetical protein